MIIWSKKEPLRRWSDTPPGQPRRVQAHRGPIVFENAKKEIKKKCNEQSPKLHYLDFQISSSRKQSNRYWSQADSSSPNSTYFHLYMPGLKSPSLRKKTAPVCIKCWNYRGNVKYNCEVAQTIMSQGTICGTKGGGGARLPIRCQFGTSIGILTSVSHPPTHPPTPCNLN